MKTLLFLPFLVLGSLLLAQDAKPQNLKDQPLLFLENKGQVLDFEGHPRPDVLFMMRGSGVNVFLGKGELHYLFSSPVQKAQQLEGRKGLNIAPNETDLQRFLDPEYVRDTAPTLYETYRIDISLQGMNQSATVEALDKNEYYENYYNIPGHYRDGILNVRSYQKIAIKNVYPNIDWILYSKDGKLKHEFLLHPGADAKNIRLQVNGPTDLLVNAAGELVVTTPLGTIVEDKPFIPEDPTIEGSFEAQKTGELAYEIGYALKGIHEVTSALTIDPGIEWSTYFGGSETDVGSSTAAHDGRVYVGGSTISNSNISHSGFQSTRAGGDDIYVARFSPNGSRIWSTFYGGTKGDVLHGMRAFSGGVRALGITENTGLGYNSFDTSFYASITSDALLIAFDTMGQRDWAGYIGGSSWDYAMDLDILSNGDIAVSGYTSSPGMATSGAFQTTISGSLDIFITLIAASGDSLKWYTYYGGPGEDRNYAIECTDSAIYVVGSTYSSSGIASGGFQNTYSGGTEGYLAKFDISGNRKWSTYFGTSNHDYIADITVYDGDLYLTGGTTSGSGMAYGKAYQSTGKGSGDVLLSRISQHGSIIWSTYFGDAGDQIGRSLQVDKTGQIWVAVSHGSPNSTIGKDLYFDVSFKNPNNDLFVLIFDTSCNYLCGTFYHGLLAYFAGSSINTYSSAVSLDESDIYIYVSENRGVNTIRSNYQSAPLGSSEAFLVKWSIASFATPIVTNQTSFCAGNSIRIYSEQYAVGRSPNGKTITQLSDSNGIFNANSKILNTRNDTVSRYEYITTALPAICPPGKNYRVRMLLNNPADTSEPSLPFEVLPSPFAKLLTPLSTQFCDNDSMKLEVDSLGTNKIRWYRVASPTPNAGDTNQVYFAKQSGKHYAVITSAIGCTYPTNSVSLTAWPQPYAGFSTSKTEMCFKNNSFSFSDTSKAAAGDVIINSQWYFGDGQSSGAPTTTYSYSKPGNYLLKLGITTQKGCRDTVYQSINVWPEPLAKISVNRPVQCLQGNEFLFTDSSEIDGDSIVHRNWKIGGQDITNTAVVEFSYNTAGIKNPYLAVGTSRGCRDSVDTTVRVASNPSVEIIASKAGFCKGDSVKLEFDNSSSLYFQWYVDSNKLVVEFNNAWYTKQTGTYTVHVANNDNCGSISKGVTVVAYADPKPDLGADKVIKNDSQIVLDPGVFKSYLWNKGAVTNTVTLGKSNLDTGYNMVWVKVTDSNGCKGSDSVLVRLEPVNSAVLPLFSEVKVYPIPVEEKLFIETDVAGITAASAYILFTANGEMVAQGNLKEPLTAIDMSRMASGVYILRIQNHRSQMDWKVVK